MFVNCKHCNALVATDPATDLPPERCPRCAGVLREPVGAAATAAPADASGPADAMPTISSLLRPPDVSERLATPETPSATPAVGEAPEAGGIDATDAVESTVEAIAEPTAAVTTPAEEETAAPAPESPIAPSAAGGIGSPNAMADVGLDAPLPSPPVHASPVGDVANAIEAAAPVLADEPELGEAEPGTASALPEAVAEPESASASTPAPEHNTSDGADATAAPSFLPARPRASRATASRRWLPAAAIAALALLLGLQVLLADRARLAADAQWRPLVVSLCNAFGCDVPAWREPAAFTLLAREVRPHPQVAGALRVDAAFRNDARWPQAWPRLLLTLSDVEGRPVAARAFDAGEYLAEPAAAMLDSGATARIRIDLREPAAATVSYSFDFR